MISIVIAVVLVLSLAAVIFYPSFQDFMASNTMWNGITSFSSQFKVKNIDSFIDLPQNNSGNRVLIIIPYLEYNNDDLSQIQRFLGNGNTIILMDDFGFGNEVLDYLGSAVRFEQSPLLDPLFNYKNQYLPRITDFAPVITDSGISAIAFNHASSLNNVPDAQILARSSIMSFKDLNANGVKDPNEPTGPFAVAALLPVNRGQVIVISDPSLVINTMMAQNDNLKFMSYFLDNRDQGDTYLDRAHLSKAPLDTAKISFATIKSVLSNPYVTVCLMAGIFIIGIYYTLRKGEIFG